MNLPIAISPTTTSFAAARKCRRLGVLARERPEHELRHRHVGGRVDPVPGDVAKHDGEPAVTQLEEVEDVAADVDLGSGLVDRADFEPRDRGPLARQQRSLHRLRELLLLLVEPGVVDRERGLLAIVRAVASVSGVIGAAGSSDRMVSCASNSPAVAIGRSAAVAPPSRNGKQQRVGAAEPLGQRGVEHASGSCVRGGRG